MQGYTYADNNPITNLDPTGRSFWDFLGKATPWLAFGASVLALACGPIAWVAFGATVVHMAYAATKKDTAGVALDLVGLATFGVGQWLSLGAKTLRVSANAKSWLETGAKWTDIGGVPLAVPGAIEGMGYHNADSETEERHVNEEAQRGNDGPTIRAAVKHAQDRKANEAADDQLTAAVIAMGPEYWPIMSDDGVCNKVGVATVGVGSYPCSAPGAVLGQPRKMPPPDSALKAFLGLASKPWSANRAHKPYYPYYWVTHRTNLGNGTPRAADEPTWQNPNQGGYYRVDDRYVLRDGHGRAMS
jgi:hypothetical protein